MVLSSLKKLMLHSQIQNWVGLCQCTRPLVPMWNVYCRLYTMHKFRQIWHKSWITHSVYPGDLHPIRAWFDSSFAIRHFATTSGFCTNHQKTRIWFALICLWCVYLYTLFVHFGEFLVYSGSFSTQVSWLPISWLVCGCSWWFADGCANHEFDEFMNSV